MSWFFIALVGPTLLALANHTDKYLISKYFKEGAVGAMAIFSALFGITTMFVAWSIRPEVLSIHYVDVTILIIGGALSVLAILCYFYALHKDEPSHVVPLYQTIPVFGFVIGYFALGETISATQGVASFIIIIGALVLSLELGETIRFRKMVIMLMLTASVLYATCSVLFKFVAAGNGFWVSLFWTATGQVALGLSLLLFVRPYREQFFVLIGGNRKAGLGLNALSEVLFTIAEGATAFATLLAPVALVLLVNSFQPLFVFIIGVLLSLLLPHVGDESLLRKHLLQKILGIGLMIIGTYFIGVWE